MLGSIMTKYCYVGYKMGPEWLQLFCTRNVCQQFSIVWLYLTGINESCIFHSYVVLLDVLYFDLGRSYSYGVKTSKLILIGLFY